MNTLPPEWDQATDDPWEEWLASIGLPRQHGQLDQPDTGDRYPRIRTGEREPICPLVRWLVWHRDGGRCRHCGDQPTEVDHVVPWSAGGTDHATNLRLLCTSCNSTRSNYRLAEWPRLIPVTRVCDQCLNTGSPDHMYRRQDELIHQHWCAKCVFPADAWRPTDDELITAFCGHCMTVSTVTDRRRLM